MLQYFLNILFLPLCNTCFTKNLPFEISKAQYLTKIEISKQLWKFNISLYFTIYILWTYNKLHFGLL